MQKHIASVMVVGETIPQLKARRRAYMRQGFKVRGRVIKHNNGHYSQSLQRVTRKVNGLTREQLREMPRGARRRAILGLRGMG